MSKIKPHATKRPATRYTNTQEAKQIIAHVTLPPTCGGTEHQNCSDSQCGCICHAHGLAPL